MSIWIPRSTSGFTSSDGSIKIGETCYKAVQKNITKSQVPLADTYDPGSHGELGDKYDGCPSCNTASSESTWAALFWLNTTCGSEGTIDGFGAEFYEILGDGNYNFTNPSGLYFYEPDIPRFLDALIDRRTSVSRIVENPTVSSFEPEYDMPPPNNSSSNYLDWMTTNSCSINDNSWSLYFLHPQDLGLNTFKNGGGDFGGTITKSFWYKKGTNKVETNLNGKTPTEQGATQMSLTRLTVSQGSDSLVNNVSITKV
jgi:hypothetical protein|tara:strand:- start:5299 stop:6066 length:768 start_codon:yes stop_codon:yes gene_type:complete